VTTTIRTPTATSPPPPPAAPAEPSAPAPVPDVSAMDFKFAPPALEEPPADGAPADEPAAEDDEVVVGDSGTHEFECTSCGYVLFPAAGREFKFFGDDFKCPQCGSGKDAFVDNGPV